jgi:hypothetical protein
LIKKLWHLARRRVVLEGNLHRGKCRLGVGRHLVEIGQLLQLLFDRIGNLRLHLGGGSPGPRGGDDHDFDRE